VEEGEGLVAVGADGGVGIGEGEGAGGGRRWSRVWWGAALLSAHRGNEIWAKRCVGRVTPNICYVRL
jgi:hypothetical protein